MNLNVKISHLSSFSSGNSIICDFEGGMLVVSGGSSDDHDGGIGGDGRLMQCFYLFLILHPLGI